MKKFLTLPLAVIILAIGLASSISAQTNRISGFVFTSGRQPVPQIWIELLNDFNSVIQRTRTDGSGFYSFIGMSAGRFTIRIMTAGTNLEETSADVEVVNTPIAGRPLSDMVQKDFYIKTRKTAGENEMQITGTVFAQEVPKDAQKYYEKALKDFEKGKSDEAILNLESAIKSFPDYFSALDRLGREYLRQKKFNEATPYLNRAASVNPKDAKLSYALAYSTCNTDQTFECVEAGKKAVELNPSSFDVALLYGLGLRKNKQYEDAERAMLQAKKLANGNSPDVSWNLALLYAYNMNKFKEAADELENYLRLLPKVENAEAIKKLIVEYREKAKEGGSR